MNKIFLILKKEIREMFRDKKSLAMMLIIPLMIPLIIIGFSFMFEDETEIPLDDYNDIGFAYEVSEEEKVLIKELEIDAIYGSVNELKEKSDKGDIELYITKEDNNYIINGKKDDNTTMAVALINSFYDAYKSNLQAQYLIDNTIDPNDVLNIINIETNIEDDDNFFANYLTVYGFMFIIMAITVSATYPATDATAGEKERGTLETLLTFPIKSRDIIVGKFLSVSVSSIITGLLSLILLLVSLKYCENNFKIYEGFNLMLPPINIILVILIIVLYSILISGLCIAISSKSKTVKEAQSSVTPLTFISFFPGMIAFLMDLETTRLLALIPFLNLTMIFNDIQNGIIDIINILLVFVSTIFFIVLVLYIIIKQYKSEKVLFSK